MNRGTSILLAVGLLANGCNTGPTDPTRDDTPTQGKILIMADADCQGALDREVSIFHELYLKTEINVRYMSEAELLKAALNDSVRCVVTTVEPGAEQMAYYNQRRIVPRIVPIYHSAIVLVANKASALEGIDLQQLTRLLDHGTEPDTLGIVFAGAGSGMARLMRDSLGLTDLRAGALPDVPAVVAQVAKSKRTLGVIPFEAISDLNDPAMLQMREQVRVLAVAQAPGAPLVLPSQSTIADRAYPLRRTVMMLVVEGKSGLGTGFASFVASHKGQRIILKRGLVPITIPERTIEMVPSQ